MTWEASSAEGRGRDGPAAVARTDGRPAFLPGQCWDLAPAWTAGSRSKTLITWVILSFSTVM